MRFWGRLTGDPVPLLPVSALKTDFFWSLYAFSAALESALGFFLEAFGLFSTGSSAACLDFSLRALDSLHLLVAVVI